MTLGRPLIGITPGYDYGKDVAYVKSGYYEGIIKAGGLAVMMPLTNDEMTLDRVFDICDGFLISGGPDVDAGHYGEENLPCNGEISPERDRMEMYVIKKAISQDKPVLGICRGIQVMNIALGGTLYQDIYTQIKDKNLIKHSQNAPKWYPIHDIVVHKNSRVWESFLCGRVGVNSFHHQAIKDVAPGFKVTSTSLDGIIESIEYEGHVFAVGVQWHPELMWQKNDIYLHLFEQFIKSCG